MKKESSGILRFLYNTVPGRMVLKIITSPTISKIGGAYMDCRVSKIHIKGFIKNNNIDMTQYEKAKYGDGRLSAYHISENSDFYIKKSYYSVADLIKNSKKAPDFNGGVCLVFRLCVDDYHRYGYVDDGKIVENNYVPGVLHTVRPIALNRYPVFVQNSREYSVIETNNFGTIAQIEVGALMIGKIKNHQKSGLVKKGREKGMFLYGGSTIVVLLEKDKVHIDEKYFRNTANDIETKVKFGSTIGIKSSD